MGRRDELDKDLEEYLARKRKKKIDVLGMIKGIMPKPSPPPVELPPEIHTYDAEEEKIKAEPKIEIIKEEKEVPKEGIDEYEAEAKSLWQIFLEKIGLKPSKAVEKEEEKIKEEGDEAKIKEMVEKELMLKDLRNLAKITLFAVKQLPQNRLKEFKQSSDFNDLKEILKKYKFIK